MRDACAAVELGADAVGVIFAEQSPRRVTAQTAREIAAAVPAFVSLVGVFVDPPAARVREAAAAGFLPQFCGAESAAACAALVDGPYLKVFHLPPRTDAAFDAAAFERAAHDYAGATWMFDTAVAGRQGGTGRTFDWEVTRAFARARPIVISGGLTPENVGACIRSVRPFAVDVRSGIETDGVKDLQKMRAFVRAVKEADEQA